MYAWTHLPVGKPIKIFTTFISSLRLNVAVFLQSGRLVLRYKLNHTAPDNGYCRVRQAERGNRYAVLWRINRRPLQISAVLMAWFFWHSEFREMLKVITQWQWATKYRFYSDDHRPYWYNLDRAVICDTGLKNALIFQWNGVIREWRKIHNEELNDLYCSPNVVRVVKYLVLRGTR